MTDEQTTVKRAAQDKQAFTALYHAYYSKLYAYLLVRTHSRELAEDITQETFVKALKAIKSYRYRGYSFGAWLFTIAFHELVSHHRKHGRVQVSEEELLELHMPHAASPQEYRVAQEQVDSKALMYKELFKAMEELSIEERELLNLKYFAGLSYGDIQKIHKKRPNTLAVTIHRAIQKLRTKLTNI